MTPEDIARVFDVPLNMVEGSGQYANVEDEAREKREWAINQIALAATDWTLRGEVYYSADTGEVIPHSEVE